MKRLTCIIILLTSILLCSCRSTRYVPVETLKRDSVYITQVERDSIVCHDSVYVHDKGDTIVINKYRYVYKDRLVRDTLVTIRADTIRVPYPVEKKLTQVQSAQILIGKISIGFLIIILVVVGYKIYKLIK